MDFFPAAVGFWIAFCLACAWLLPRYYRTQGRGRMRELRSAVMVMDVLVLLSLALPWIPASRGGPTTGVAILMEGDMLFAAFVFCVFSTPVLLLRDNNPLCLKIAVCTHISSVLVLFAAMLRLLPGTFTLMLGETAPVIAALLLLCGSVAVLLLLHQSQKRKTVK